MKIGVLDTRIFIRSGDDATEKLEMSIRTDVSRDARCILMTVWHDRWIRLDMWQGSKNGWKWELTFEGRYFDRGGPKGLLHMVEKTASAIWRAPDNLKEIKDMWSTKLAIGPHEMR